MGMGDIWSEKKIEEAGGMTASDFLNFFSHWKIIEYKITMLFFPLSIFIVVHKRH